MLNLCAILNSSAMAEAAIPPGQKAKIIFNPVKSKVSFYYLLLLLFN